MTGFFGGLIAGCCSATIVNPLEVIKVRQMLTKKQYKGLIKGARTVYRSGGLLAFYEGWTASMLMVCFHVNSMKMFKYAFYILIFTYSSWPRLSFLTNKLDKRLISSSEQKNLKVAQRVAV